MKIYKYPDEAALREIVTRPTKDAADLTATVSAVLQRVKAEGDKAVLDYERQFDKADLQLLAVSDEEFQAAQVIIKIRI